jgi:hypothetical protein
MNDILENKTLIEIDRLLLSDIVVQALLIEMVNV